MRTKLLAAILLSYMSAWAQLSHTDIVNYIHNTEYSYDFTPSTPVDSMQRQWMDFPLTFDGYRNLNPSYNLTTGLPDNPTLTSLLPEPKPQVLTPLWIGRQLRSMQLTDALRYKMMIDNPSSVVFISRLLPDPPKLIENKVDPREEIIADIPFEIPEETTPTIIGEIKRTNWLHTLNGSIQFSQAYLSPNWYQGGNNSLSLLVNFLWDVKLNEVYHPNLLLNNTISYKLGLNSTPQDEYHNYAVSEDIFQWNFKFGVKAFKKWFYSFTTQFKTQLLNTYGENSTDRKAALLSPGSLTLGLGMTYNTTNKAKTLKFNASISPLSYNLNICNDRLVDPTQYNIPAGSKAKSEIGSNAELSLEWQLARNITWRSRLFTFTNYQYFLGEWENTFNFTINKFLSTQIYLHMRYDSSTVVTDLLKNSVWKKFMLKEILSFGFSYAFSTK